MNSTSALKETLPRRGGSGDPTGGAEPGRTGGEDAWEHYAAEEWDNAAAFLGHDDQRAHAIAVLAGLELAQRTAPARAARTLHELDGTAVGFGDLIIGMRAHHSGEPDLCARHTGRWLLAHDFFATWILDRFTAAAQATENHALLFGVCNKFLKRRAARPAVVGPALSAAHALGKHRDAAALFYTYRELLDSPLLLQKAAFSLLHLGEHSEAENLLVGLYRRVTGRPYKQEPHLFDMRRERAATRVAELRLRPALSMDEERDLGLSLLFLGKSSEALRVLEHSLARATKGRTPLRFD